jgi:hypothetical protein
MRGVTQVELARKLYTSQAQISAIEQRSPYEGTVGSLRDYTETGLGLRLLLVVSHGGNIYVLT